MGNVLRVVALGRGIALEFDESLDASTVAQIRAAWRDADGPALMEGPVRAVAHGPGGHDPITAADAASLASNVSVGVTLAALDANRGSLLMLHACGVATEAGEVIAFVGPSGRGKTTAALALGTHFGYVSDETVAVQHDRTVLPYRKPLSIIPAHAPGTPKQQIAPSELGLRPLPDAPLRLAALVLLDRDPEGPDTPTIDMVSMDEAIVELVPQLSYLPEMSEPLQRLSALIEATGGVRRVRYREAHSLPDAVGRLLASTAASEFPEAVMALPDGVDDAITIGASTLVLAGSTLSVLTGIGPTVWREAIAGARRDEIVARTVAAHGEPPSADAHALVEDALTALAENGLLGPANVSA